MNSDGDIFEVILLLQVILWKWYSCKKHQKRWFWDFILITIAKRMILNKNFDD
jgi:hypothetical protein